MSIKNNNVFFKNNVLYHIDSSGDVEVISYEPNSGSGGYLLAGDYIKIEDNTIDVDYNLSGLATISSVNNLSTVYQPAGDYLTDGDLTGYQPVGNYLTEDDLSNYLTEDDLVGLATISSVNNLSAVYQPIGDYLTAHQSLDGLATVSSVNNLSAVYQPIGNYLTSIPTATTSEIGGIKVGSNLSIDNNGYLNAIAGNSYNFSGTNGVGVNLSDDTYTIKINDNLYSAISAQKILWGSESIDVTTDEDKLVLSISDEYVDLINSIPSENQYTLSAGNNISIDAITDDGDDYLVVSTDLTDYLTSRIATDENDLESGFLNIILE